MLFPDPILLYNSDAAALTVYACYMRLAVWRHIWHVCEISLAKIIVFIVVLLLS